MGDETLHEIEIFLIFERPFGLLNVLVGNNSKVIALKILYFNQSLEYMSNHRVCVPIL